MLQLATTTATTAAAAASRVAPQTERPGFLGSGNPRPVLEAACIDDPQAALAIVLETEGSTYARRGAMACFAPGRQAGWISGGCLEPRLAERALQAASHGVIDWMEIDSRGDDDLLSGSAVGCRGRLRIALLPRRMLHGLDAVAGAWLDGGACLHLDVDVRGNVSAGAGAGTAAVHASVPATPCDWHGAAHEWSFALPRPPEAAVFGAGPETPMLLRLLRDLGWRSTLVERRPRWRTTGAADREVDATPRAAATAACDAALVMHHDFELDREALATLAAAPPRFIGLLGPARRREDLFQLLSPAQHDALLPHLRSPVGLHLGGEGPEAIALSIAAQLQAWRAGDGQALDA